jgi:tetratricopeptide (TPR) repeat protein
MRMIRFNVQSRLGRNVGLAVLAASALGTIACGPPPVETLPPPPELAAQAVAAATQVNRGCYVGFKNAVDLYEKLSAQPAMRLRIGSPYVRALLLLLIRERELGILTHNCAARAAKVISENPALQQFRTYFDIADTLPPRTRGIMQDLNIVGMRKIYDDVLKGPDFQKTLLGLAEDEDYFAYVYASFFTGFGFVGDQLTDTARDVLKRFPGSLLMAFKNAIYPRENADLLNGLLRADAEFYEAHYHLGAVALQSGSLIEAEGEFLKALPGLSDSPQVQIYLASIYTATEEFERSLDYYDKTLALAPGYRDAILGKAISLSYLGRYHDAVEVLNKNTELGFYLLGESHYWLAWNYSELKDLNRAQANIEQSKPRLPTNSEVYGLAGTIALNRGELDRAETEFREALKYNAANTQALFGLGRVFAEKQRWPESAESYEKAAILFEGNERAFLAKIEEVKKAPISDERKARLIAKKDQQIRVTRSSWATAFIEAAVGFVHAGQKDRAFVAASKAAENAPFKARAEELIKKIKG